MREKMKFAVVMLVAVFCITLAGTAESAKIMRVGTIQNTEHPHHKGLEKFAQLVKQKTNGEIEVRIFPMSQLGSGPTQIQSVKLGTLEAFIEGIGMYQDLVGGYALFATAYALGSREEFNKILDGPIGNALNGELIKNHGIRMLCTSWERGPRHLLSVRPVLTVADVKGLKLRIPQNISFVVPWKILGASPTPIAFGEIYLALQQNIVEGLELPLDMIYTQKFYEAAKNISLTAHVIENAGFSVNEKWYEALTQVQRNALSEAAKGAAMVNNELTENLESAYQKKMQNEGVKFHVVNRAAFKEACKDAPREIEATGRLWKKGFYDSVLEFLKR